MNQKQREYLCSRIGCISSSKEYDIKAKYTIKAKKLDDAEMWKLILAGKHKFNKKAKMATPGYKRNHGYKLCELFDFSDYKDKADQKKIDAAIKKPEKRTQETKDRAILGDCDEAVKLLSKLESFVV